MCLYYPQYIISALSCRLVKEMLNRVVSEMRTWVTPAYQDLSHNWTSMSILHLCRVAGRRGITHQIPRKTGPPGRLCSHVGAGAAHVSPAVALAQFTRRTLGAGASTSDLVDWRSWARQRYLMVFRLGSSTTRRPRLGRCALHDNCQEGQ